MTLGPLGGGPQIGYGLGVGRGASGVDYAAKVLSYSPLGYWKLQDASGSTADDSGPNGYDGTYTGGYTLANAAGPDSTSVAYFDGTNGYVNLPAGFYGAMSRTLHTVVVWVKVNSSSTWSEVNDRGIFSISRNANQVWALMAVPNTDVWRARNRATSATLVDKDAASSASTDWVCVGMTANQSSNRLRIYINGVQVGTDGTGLGTTTNINVRAHIGAYATTTPPANYWHGWLAHVSVFNSELDSTAMADLAAI